MKSNDLKTLTRSLIYRSKYSINRMTVATWHKVNGRSSKFTSKEDKRLSMFCSTLLKMNIPMR